MKNQDLIRMLEQLYPEAEICVEIYDTCSKRFVDSTYGIDYAVNDYGEMVLKVDTEKEKF